MLSYILLTLIYAFDLHTPLERREEKDSKYNSSSHRLFVRQT